MSENKLTKKYIGTSQVGSSQVELENNLSLRAKDSLGASQDLLKLNSANEFMLLKSPFLPGDASSALQAIPKQQLDAAVSTIGSDITALQNEDLTFVKLDGSRNMTGNLSMMPSLGVHYKVTGLGDPTDPRDAANKQYVDAIAEGLHVHAPAKVIINVSLESASGGTVDYDNGASGVGATLTLSNALTSYLGYTFQNNDRVIVNGQANQAHNGIYTVGSNGTLGSVFTRALDFNTPTEIAGGDFVFIQNGTGIANTGWVETLTVSQVGIDPIVFIQFSGAGSYTAGDGLFLDGTEFNVKSDTLTNTIFINSNNEVAVKIDPAGELSSSAAGLAISSSFQGRMTTAESNITALQTGKADTDLGNLVANGSGLGYQFYSDLTFQKGVSTNVTIRGKEFISGEASGNFAVFAGSTGGGAQAGAITIRGGNAFDTALPGPAILLGGFSQGASIASGAVYVESGAASGAGASTGNIQVVTGYSTNAASGNTGQIYVSSGKSMAGVSGSVTISTGEIGTLAGMDNNSNTSNTGNTFISTGPIYNPASSATTGTSVLASGLHAGLGQSGPVYVGSGEHTNTSNSATTGEVNVASGPTQGLGQTGTAQLQSGVITNPASSANTGFAQVRSGDNAGSGSSGVVYISSGNNSGTGNSGNIELNVGSVGSGTRGSIILNGAIVSVGSQINMNSNKIINVTDPTAAQDAATKAYVDSQVSGGSLSAGQGITIVSAAINANVDTTTIAINGSNQISIASAVMTRISTLETEMDTAQADILALDVRVDALESDVSVLIPQMSQAQSDISALQAEDLTFLKLDGTRSMTAALNMGTHKITNVVDPTSAQDVATKAYVDAQVAGGTFFEVQKVVLSATDILNQYVDLSFKASPGSVIASSERVNLIVVLGADADADFQQDNTGATTRLIFQGPSASAGESPLVENQIIYFNYEKV